MEKGDEKELSVEEQKELIEKTKKISVKEGCGWGVMDGFGARYISPFALAIGANNTQIGLLNSIPHLLGNLSDIYTLHEMNKWSRKKIVFWGVFLQSLMWIVLIGIGALFFILNLKNNIPAYGLIIVYTLLIVFGAFASPAWMSWMKDLVTQNLGNYFGKRNRIVGIVAFVSLLVAGFILDYFKKTSLFIGFIILFLIASFGRMISAFLMLRQYEPKLHPDKSAYFSMKQFIKRIPQSNFGKFVVYFSLVSLAVNIAGPFFAVYMLKDLEFSYTAFMVVILSSAVASFLFMPLWGRFSDKHGNIKTIQICGFLIILIPFLWLLSVPLINMGFNLIILFLIVIEIFSGFAWAGFNLATSDFIYEAVSRQKVARCVTYFNIINSIGVLIGAGLGGLISSQDFVVFGLSSLLFIFLLSGIVRLIVYLTLNRKLKEIREVQDFSVRRYAKEKIIQMEKLLKNFDINRLRGR